MGRHQGSNIYSLILNPGNQRGRPCVDPRECLEGAIWVLKSGAQWQGLTDLNTHYSTCLRRHNEWVKGGIWVQAWQRLLSQMVKRKLIHWSEAMGDGTFKVDWDLGAGIPSEVRVVRLW